jgi:hypothetical protein
MIQSRFVKMLPSVLTPFVRSDAVGAILAEVFTNPDTELSIAEITRRAEVLPAVAHREVTRLLNSEVLSDRRDGNNRLVKTNKTHPLYPQMAEIIAAAYGPVPVLRGLLEDVNEVEAAFIYGSWAARRQGEPGAHPRDIDVMAIGNLSLDDMLQIQQTARDRLRTDVNIHRITSMDWTHPKDNPFLATVATRPIVWLFGKEGTDE